MCSGIRLAQVKNSLLRCQYHIGRAVAVAVAVTVAVAVAVAVKER